MNKSNLLTLGISIVVLATVVVVALMILLPQQAVVLEASTVKYDALKKSDFKYEQTKDITREALVKEYSITSSQMEKFKKNNQYVSGNSDPFTPRSAESDKETTSSNSSSSSNKNNTTANNKNNNTTSNNNSNTSSSVTTDKITNSNGGVPNPPSTNK